MKKYIKSVLWVTIFIPRKVEKKFIWLAKDEGVNRYTWHLGVNYFSPFGLILVVLVALVGFINHGRKFTQHLDFKGHGGKYGKTIPPNQRLKFWEYFETI